MATYGYIRTSRDQELDRPGMNPETQRRDLIEAGVPERNIHADIDVSGATGVATRNGWRSVDSKLKHGDILVVAALDRIGRRSLDVMGKIYDLVDRGVRLRSLADNEAWAKGLDADPESMEWMTAMPIRPGVLLLRAARAPSNCSPDPGRPGASPGRGQALGPPTEPRRRSDDGNPPRPR